MMIATTTSCPLKSSCKWERLYADLMFAGKPAWYLSMRSVTSQSLTSRGLVKQQFAWRHYYWTLTNEGIEYLREYLHLPPEIVPMTMKKQATIVDDKQPRGGRVGPARPAYSGDQREEYRREKDANVGPGGAGFGFRGGAGRGAGRGGPAQ